ncbi:hypothetical protein NCCP1664_24690 [Zafaria cholistanensis]|uniref:Uncharacterized protein n=1 Tax=Zafaria cholistanensis TaxID=1682741 RepID=A0A5A7NST2_9MICC|nr:hypothetical protein NCCP1664_24690 [Zafaria cholistanensis]
MGFQVPPAARSYGDRGSFALNVSSERALTGFPFPSVYAATKIVIIRCRQALHETSMHVATAYTG